MFRSPKANPNPGLRLRAEALAESSDPLMRELQVHQFELEMQNEELQRAHEELDISRARYFDLYDLAPVGYLTLTPTGRILEANLTAATMLGRERGELENGPITRFIQEEDQGVYRDHRQRCIDTTEPQACELRMVKADGTTFWVRLTGTETRIPPEPPWAHAAGPSVTRVVMSDFTERVALEEEKARLELLLQKGKKLETLGVLAGGVAHDFNNLLTTILGNANMGATALAHHAEALSYFQAIEKASLRAADLTSQLLAYTGKGRWVALDMDLGNSVKEILQIVTVSLPANLTLHSAFADRLPMVKGDPNQISRILMNLVMNAFEAFPVGKEGRITVRTGSQWVKAAGKGAWALPVLPGHFVTVEVEDEGAGMTPDTLARAFEPFFTTKFTGRGLGLAAVIGILGSHGGGLKVRSEPGEGSSFKIYLPVKAGLGLHAPVIARLGPPMDHREIA